MTADPAPFRRLLDAYDAEGSVEAADVARLRAALDTDWWSRSTPLHVTASALVVHPASRRVLLRWHERMRRWMQVGGHFDPGEADPLLVAWREAREETGLADLALAPGARGLPVQVVIVPVAAGRGEPAHEHADIRYLFVTDEPESVVPETEGARLRWLSIRDAAAEAGEDNLRELVGRAARRLGWSDP
jgi:8-oxo-dGTP pyrophosphatase MutT (NUDIX family)